MAGHQSLVTHCVSLVFLTSVWNVGFSLDLSCVGVKKEYNEKMGLRDDTVPISAIPGNHLQVCPQGTTCCTEDMESKLISLSGKEYDSVVDRTFKFIKSTFVSRTKKFDDFFTELLEKSKQDLHVMFVRTYGQLYKQNAEMFSDLFDELKHYYKGSNVSLLEILNNFFKGLLERMFELMNAQYLFDEDYMSCVTRHMEDLKPFGDVPSKLKRQVKRAFIAARTFVQGLAIGRDVILAMERVKPTDECRRGLTRMMYCPYCQNLLRTKPCNNYCLNTMKGCLAQHSELNKAWNEYIDALKLVAQRLEGPFNIETVVDPIDVKISEAIMNFQEGQVDVNDRIFKGCGTPRMKPAGSRYKREAAAAGSGYEDFYSGEYMNFENRRHSTSEERPDTAAGTNLDKLVKDIKEKTDAAKNFWIQLPYMICSGGIAAEQGEEDDCWNGRDRSRYVHPVQKDGRMYQVNNPEVTVDVQEDNGIVSVQIYNLKLITTKLHNAYHGVDVEWTIPEIDVDADVHEGSGTDELEGSGRQGNRPTGGKSDGKTGDNIEASGDDEIDGSGSGSGDGYDGDDEDIVPYPPTRTNRPPIYDPVPYHPDGTGKKNPYGGNTDRHPPYNVPNTTKKDKGTSPPAGGASCVRVSTSALMTLSMLAVVLYRIVL